MTRETLNKIGFLLVLAVFFIGVGWFANDWHDSRSDALDVRRVKQKGFRFISPLLDVELPEGYSVRREPIPFKDKLSKYVQEQIAAGQVLEMSVYFRDLSDGPWFGINEKIKYNPASMMKVPIMVAWLKRAERDPSVLQSKFIFDEKNYNGPPQGYKPAQTLKDGAAYTVETLLRYMMYYSDNKSLWLLQINMNAGEYEYVLDNMDVTNEQENGHDSITVHSYSGFLRILYNASFLNKEMSEKALQLMSYQDFPMGIAAGLPPDTKLASKFGEYSDSEHPDLIQLHEFGIVYHPKGPYILGILTRGHDVNKQAGIIKTVSKNVYDLVNNQIRSGIQTDEGIMQGDVE